MGDDFVCHLPLVVFAHADQPALYAVCAQQAGGYAGVLGADKVGVLQDGERAQSDVGQIADGRGDNV